MLNRCALRGSYAPCLDMRRRPSGFMKYHWGHPQTTSRNLGVFMDVLVIQEVI